MNLDQKHKLKEALKIITGAAPGGGGLALQDAIKSVDHMVESKEINLGPELQHYLKNRSYQKAMAFLDSR